MREAHALYRSFGFEEIAPYEGREFAAIPDAEKIQVFMALDLARDETFSPRQQRRT